MNKLKHVIKFEFLRIIKTKGFIIAVMMLPVFILGSSFLVYYLTTKDQNDVEKKYVVGINQNNADSILLALQNYNTDKLSFETFDDVEKFRSEIFCKIKNGYIEHDSLGNYNFYSDNYIDLYVSNETNELLKILIRDHEIRHSGIDSAQMSRILNVPNIKTFTINNEKPGEATYSDAKGNFLMRTTCGQVLAFLIMMCVMMFSQAVGNSVLEDKTTKIADVLLTSVKPEKLLAGKVIGIGSAGLIQFVVWVSIMLTVLYFTGNSFDAIFTLLSPWFLILTFVFFIFGFFTMTAIYGALGSLADSQQHYGHLVSGMSFFLALPFMLLVYISSHPDSMFSIVTSMIPGLSTSLMPMRILSGEVPAWQVFLSLLILVGSAYYIVKLSGKVFRYGIMYQGKPLKLKDVLQIIKM
ncbi:MAG: ABC transporter permease [Bacteroidales bacterium]|nr:ABC transporter permease [Bacteroidales bacterium]